MLWVGWFMLDINLKPTAYAQYSRYKKCDLLAEPILIAYPIHTLTIQMVILMIGSLQSSPHRSLARWREGRCQYDG